MTAIHVSTTVTITDSLGRDTVAVTQTADARPGDNSRFWATYTRGAIQATEYAVNTMLVAQYGDKPDDNLATAR